MTDLSPLQELAKLQDQALSIRVAELTDKLERVNADNDVIRDKVKTQHQKVRALVQQLIDLDEILVNEVLEEAGIKMPRKEYAFTIPVTALAVVKGYGTDEDDAWSQLIGDGFSLDESDIKDYSVSYNTTRGNYEEAEEIDTEPLDIRGFMGRAS